MSHVYKVCRVDAGVMSSYNPSPNDYSKRRGVSLEYKMWEKTVPVIKGSKLFAFLTRRNAIESCWGSYNHIVVLKGTCSDIQYVQPDWNIQMPAGLMEDIEAQWASCGVIKQYSDMNTLIGVPKGMVLVPDFIPEKVVCRLNESDN